MQQSFETFDQDQTFKKWQTLYLIKIYEIPKMQKIVMDTSDSNIIFDSNGVCDHCIGFQKILFRIESNSVGEQILENQIKKIKTVEKIISLTQ